MNLILHGSHAATDWLIYKLRSRSGPLALHLEDNGDLTTRDARNCKGGESLLGVYRNGAAYRDMEADLRTIRDDLLRNRRLTQKAHTDGGRMAA